MTTRQVRGLGICVLVLAALGLLDLLGPAYDGLSVALIVRWPHVDLVDIVEAAQSLLLAWILFRSAMLVPQGAARRLLAAAFATLLLQVLLDHVGLAPSLWMLLDAVVGGTLWVLFWSGFRRADWVGLGVALVGAVGALLGTLVGGFFAVRWLAAGTTLPTELARGLTGAYWAVAFAAGLMAFGALVAFGAKLARRLVSRTPLAGVTAPDVPAASA